MISLYNLKCTRPDLYLLIRTNQQSWSRFLEHKWYNSKILRQGVVLMKEYKKYACTYTNFANLFLKFVVENRAQYTEQ